MTVTVREIADFLDTQPIGPSTRRVSQVNDLGQAGTDELAFCVYDDSEVVKESDAGVIVCPPTIPGVEGKTLVHASNPRLAFARIVDEFFVESRRETVIHPTAVVEPGATIGERCRIGPSVYIDDCVTIGDDCTIRSGTAIGCQGFGFPRDDEGELHRLHHQGGVRIEDHVEIGANTSIDRAVFQETVIGEGSKLSGNIHLAHQAQIGRQTSVAYGCGLAGGVTVGDEVTMHPHVTIATDVTVADMAEIGMNSTVLSDVPAGTTVVGSPAKPLKKTPATPLDD